MLEMTSIEHNAWWFHVNGGLLNEGLLVGSMVEADAPLSIIDSYFGFFKMKKGWKYEEYVEHMIAKQTKTLWCRVYSTNAVTNKQFTLRFARGLAVEYRDKKVNWLVHVVVSKKLKDHVRDVQT
jgi:hypothetical protein